MSTDTNKQAARKLFESIDNGYAGASEALLTADFVGRVEGNERTMNAQEFLAMGRVRDQLRQKSTHHRVSGRGGRLRGDAARLDRGARRRLQRHSGELRLATPVLLFFLAGLPGVAEGAVGDESLGVNAHNGAPEFVAAAAALGVKWVRLDANWVDHEPSDNNYSWWLDGACTQADAAGLKVFISLGYTPAWVPRHGNTDGETLNDVPNGSAEWADFVGDAVTHYRALGVRHFGMWNEANLQQFWEGSLAEYANIIVIPGAAAVRAACNDCFVLGPEFANVGPADDALETVLSAVPAGTFDIITHHSYNSFAELGWQIFDGDSFINVLDDQRFPFTRRSVRQVLDGVGYTGEVWISETGYRAAPAGDANEESRQAIYVRRVMEEQLSRAWYTNSFFYEIQDCGVDQAGCTIDGFGLMRPTAGTPGTRSFPADFRLKPAFSEIQTFIQNNPAIVGAVPATQCGDGIDNDGDNRIDQADRGCTGPQDNDESNDPPRIRMDALQVGAVAVDGDLGDLGTASPVGLGAADWRGTEALTGAADLAVNAVARWSAGALYLGLEVTDDVHQNDHIPAELWQGDSVQIAFDVSQNGGTGYDALDDHELNFALVGSTATGYRFVGPAGASNDFSAAIVRAGTTTRYEIRVGATALPGVSFQQGTLIGFSFLVNDADGAGRIGWSEWSSGIGTTKEPELFGELAFGAAVLPTDGGPPDTGADAGPDPADAALDGGTSQDSGALDAATNPDGGSAATDAGVSNDAGPTLDAGATTEGNEGCGCRSERGSPGTALLLIPLLWPLRRRT